MTRYFVTSTPFDFAAFAQRKAADLGPVHVADALAGDLGAHILQPGDVAPRRIDRVLQQLIGTPEHWAVARAVVKQARPGELIYANGSDAGLPIGLLNILQRRRRRARVAIYYVAPDRPRDRTFTRVISRLGPPLLAVTGTEEKVDYLESITPPSTTVVLAGDQTDAEFFAPADASQEAVGRPRPLIASCGLEQRDYVTLAEAVADLDVDVKICAVSPNFTSKTVCAIPDEMPDNVEMRHFEFPELRQLYREADLTVVPLLENSYAAGFTTLLEAISCGSPVVISRTHGLAEQLADRDMVVGATPGSPDDLRVAIEKTLADPDGRRARAERARSDVLPFHTSDHYIEQLGRALRQFESGTVDRLERHP